MLTSQPSAHGIVTATVDRPGITCMRVSKLPTSRLMRWYQTRLYTPSVTIESTTIASVERRLPGGPNDVTLGKAFSGVVMAATTVTSVGSASSVSTGGGLVLPSMTCSSASVSSTSSPSGGWDVGADAGPHHVGGVGGGG